MYINNDIKFALISHGAKWITVNLLGLLPSLDKQRLPQRLDKDYRTRLDLSNRRFGWFCQPIRHLWPSLPDLRGSTTRKVCALEVIQLTQIRKIKTESSTSFCSHNTAKTMVSVKPLSCGWLNGGRGHIVLQTYRKVAMKQYGSYSQDCKYGIRRFSSEPGDVLQCKGERILSDVWRRNLQNPNFINKRLWSVLKHDDIWISSFLKLAYNRGSNTPGTDNSRIANFSLDKVMAVKKDLLEGRFRWGDSRRIYIPKADGKRLRPLTIPNFRDRLIQEVLKKLLSSIYEPCFDIHSHGFRPGRSCHTALRDVRKNFKGCKWILEGDISCFFDTVSHSRLILLLQKKIKDERIISLISKGLKAKILVPETGEIILPDSGVPQGGIISPLLSNIYLHELDKYMKAYIKELNVGTERPYSLEYRRVSRNLKSRKAAKKLGLTPSDMLSDKFMRMKYVRYADDFIVGLICSRTKALKIKNHIKTFLKERLYLELNDSKTLLTDVAPRKHFNHTSQVNFLGYLISMHRGIITRTAKNRRRVTGKRHVILKVDQRKVINRLAEKGFCTKDGLPKPKFTYIHDTQAVTNEKVNRIFRGIVNYYKLADNIKHFGCRLFYIFSHSLAKMYAAKYRWHRRATIFNIGNRDLSKPLLTKRGKGHLGRITDSYQAPLKGIIYSHYEDLPRPIKAPLNPDFTSSFNEVYNGQIKEVEVIQALLRKHTIAGPIQIGKLPCIDCGSQTDVNLHHVKSLSLTDDLKKIPAKSLRKVVPVCKKCHLNRHGGSFRQPKK